MRDPIHAATGLLLMVALSPALALGAGRLPVQNISAREYGTASQSWAVYQSRRGLLYVGGNSGVHEYDGVSWQGVAVPNQTVRSFAEDAYGRILVGGVGDLGYVDHDREGRLRYVSLVDKIPEGDRDFGDVWVIRVLPDGIYFQSWFRMFRWRAPTTTSSPNGPPPFESRDLKIWKPDSAFGVLCEANGRLFIQQQGLGLTELIGDRFELLPGGDLFADADIVGELDFASNCVNRGPDEVLFVNIRRGLFLYDGQSVHPFRTDADDVLRTAYNNMSVVLPDGSLALGTYRAGLLLIDPSGHVRQINRAHGLENESIHGVALDDNGGVWVAHKAGLSRLLIPSPVTWYDAKDGLEGQVFDILRHEGRLYVATTEGVFIMADDRFYAVSGIGSETIALLSASGRLWSNSLHGVDEIRGNTSRQILAGRPQSPLVVSRRDPEKAYLGVEDGVAVLKLLESGWHEVARVPEIKTRIIGLVAANEGDLWVLPNEEARLLRVRSESNLVESYGTADGLPQTIGGVHFFDGELYVTAATGTSFRFDRATRSFRRDVSLGARFGLADAVHLEQVDAEGSRVRLGVADGDLHQQFVAEREADGSYSVHEIFTGTLDAAVWDNAFMESEGVTWFGGPDGLVRYDARVPTTAAPPFPPLIRRVRAGGELRSLRAGRLKLPYEDNRLRFEFALPDFSAPSLNRYQILLDGFDETWSEWTDETRQDYTNVNEGQYRFRVRARNAHGRVSAEAHYDFTIAPPWYRSVGAYAAYVLLLLTTGPSIYMIRVSQLRRRQRELEQVVEERTLELTERNRQISEQARQLELLARTDPLTKLANRRSMQERLTLEAARVHRGAPTFSLVVADIDEFKIFNDRYGHDCGDFVLASVGETLQRELRKQDLIARWGGEEFLLLLADASLDDGRRMAERLRETIVRTTFHYRDLSLSVRLSFGVVEFVRDGDTDAFVEAADAAMYRAKLAGRDRIVAEGRPFSREGVD